MRKLYPFSVMMITSKESLIYKSNELYSINIYFIFYLDKINY